VHAGIEAARRDLAFDVRPRWALEDVARAA
jgi:hypothetical protein